MIPEFCARTRKEWREWLRKNHKREDKVRLIKHKRHTGIPSPNNKEAMEEAICFGWIDTTIKRLDDERYRQTFVKRKQNARWSNNTIRYAEDMIKKGKMTKQGLIAYKAGKKKPTIDHNLPKDLPPPPELKKALQKDKPALKFFNSLAPSYKRFYIIWVTRAVRPETKQKRIKAILAKCRERKKPMEV